MDSSVYTCAVCSKPYKHFYNLKQHVLTHHVNQSELSNLDTKPTTKDKTNGEATFACQFCNASYSNKFSLNRHITSKVCIKKAIHDNIEQLIERKLSTGLNDTTSSKLTDVIANLIDNKQPQYNTSGNALNGNHSNMTVNTENNTDNHTENNITQNNNNALYIREVHINPMGKENLSHISDATIIQILNQGVNAVPALAKAIMELPENCNIVESDKRNKKATVVNRNGDVEVMDLNKALTMSTTDTVDKVDDYYEKFKDELPKKNKSIQRMARAHGLDSDEDSGDDIPQAETFDAYFKKYMNQIKDGVSVNKKPILDRITKYRDHKYKERTSKLGQLVN